MHLALRACLPSLIRPYWLRLFLKHFAATDTPHNDSWRFGTDNVPICSARYVPRAASYRYADLFMRVYLIATGVESSLPAFTASAIILLLNCLVCLAFLSPCLVFSPNPEGKTMDLLKWFVCVALILGGHEVCAQQRISKTQLNLSLIHI